MTAITTDWLALLRTAVAREGSVAAVARHISDAAGSPISRSAVSAALNGNYPGGTDRIAKRVLDTYARVDCPFLQRSITHGECRTYREAPVPTSSPLAMRHWRACRTCAIGKALATTSNLTSEEES
jgi:hypothetical protein